MSNDEVQKLTPRPYQVEGIQWLSTKKRAMLVDAPGLGKTLQAAEAAVKPVLVVAPTYLVLQWEDFLSSQYPNDTVLAATGPRQQRLAIVDGDLDWLIVNTAMLRTYTFKPVQTLIVDESHHLRGRTSQQAQAALKIAMRTPRVYLLTASPVMREPDDLFMQLRILDPKTFSSYWRFVNTFCTVVHTPWADKVVGVNKNMEVRLRGLLSKYMLGRDYKAVGLQLPDLIENKIRVEFSTPEARRYKEVKTLFRQSTERYRDPGSVLHALRRLTTTCKAKMDAVKQLVEDTEGKIVIYTWYRETATSIAQALGGTAITGDDTPEDRVRFAKQETRVIVATLASMSEGVDLSDARTVIFYEEDYVPGNLYQALSRVRRYSKDPSPVRVYYILVRGTVDEVVYRIVDKRISSIKLIVDEALK